MSEDLCGPAVIGRRERLTGSFATRAVASILDQAAFGALTFIVNLFIGRVIGADGLGLYATTNALFLLIASFYNGALLDPMSVHGPRQSVLERPVYQGFLLLAHLLCIFAIVFTAAVMIMLWRIARQPDGITISAVAACIGYACVILYQYLLRRHFYVEQKVFTAATQSVCYLLLTLALLFAVYTVFRPQVADIYGALGLASLLVCAGQSVRLYSALKMPGREQVRRFAGEHWRYGRWVLATSPLYVCSMQGYYLLAAYLLPPEQIRYLKAAETMIGPFSQFAMGLVMLMLPMTARRIDAMARGKRLQYLCRTFATFSAIALPYSAMLLFFGDELLVLAFGEKLAPAATLVPYMSGIPSLAAVVYTTSIAISALKRPDLHFYSYLIVTLGMLVFGLFLMHFFGIQGAVIGMLISWSIFALIQLKCCLMVL